MDNLVNRLREKAEGNEFNDNPWWWDVEERGGPAPILREAAERIEQLEKGIEFLLDKTGSSIHKMNRPGMSYYLSYANGEYGSAFMEELPSALLKFVTPQGICWGDYTGNPANY